MSTLKEFLKELDEESIVTRKMLERVPDDKLDWQPHVKSMKMRNLAGHVAELTGWMSLAFVSEEMDFAANPYSPPVWNTNAELLALFEKELAAAREHLMTAKEEDLDPQWTLRDGDTIYMTITKRELVRHSMSQIIHHRAQLGVYLRLLDTPIPGSYGPSADEQ